MASNVEVIPSVPTFCRPGFVRKRLFCCRPSSSPASARTLDILPPIDSAPDVGTSGTFHHPARFLASKRIPADSLTARGAATACDLRRKTRLHWGQVSGRKDPFLSSCGLLHPPGTLVAFQSDLLVRAWAFRITALQLCTVRSCPCAIPACLPCNHLAPITDYVSLDACKSAHSGTPSFGHTSTTVRPSCVCTCQPLAVYSLTIDAGTRFVHRQFIVPNP